MKGIGAGCRVTPAWRTCGWQTHTRLGGDARKSGAWVGCGWPGYFFTLFLQLIEGRVSLKKVDGKVVGLGK